MYKKILLHSLLFLAFCFNSVMSQTIPIKSYGPISLGDFNRIELISDDLNQYPYTNIGVITGKMELLNDKNFIKKFTSITHYFQEVSVNHKGQEYAIPISLYQKEKGSKNFTSINSFSCFVLRGIPNENLSLQPNKFKVINTLGTRNSVIGTLMDLTSSVNDILKINLKNTLTKPDELLGFINKTLSNYETKEYSITTTYSQFLFPPKAPTEKIHSVSLYAIIPLNEINNYNSNRFKLKASIGGGDPILFYDDSEFNYPYTLLIETLSNYLKLDGIPTDMLSKSLLKDLDSKKIQELESGLISYSSNLTDNQIKYESIILEYIKCFRILKAGVEIQSSEDLDDIRTNALIKAYNVYFTLVELENELNYLKGKGENLYNYYKINYSDNLIKSVNDEKSKLNFLQKAIGSYELRNRKNDKFNDNNLRTLHEFKSQAIALPYLKNSFFYFNIEDKIKEVENYLFEKYFREKYSEIINAEIYENSTVDNLNVLKLQKDLYPSCEQCRKGHEEAQGKINRLIQDRDESIFRTFLQETSQKVNSFIKESENSLKAQKLQIEDSKNDNGLVRKKLAYSETGFSEDILKIKSLSDDLANLKGKSKKKEAEDKGKSIDDLMTSFKFKYYVELMSIY